MRLLFLLNLNLDFIQNLDQIFFTQTYEVQRDSHSSLQRIEKKCMNRLTRPRESSQLGLFLLVPGPCYVGTLRFKALSILLFIRTNHIVLRTTSFESSKIRKIWLPVANLKKHKVTNLIGVLNVNIVFDDNPIKL